MNRLMGTLVGVISLGLGLAGLTPLFLFGIVTSAQAITIQQAKITRGAVVVTGKKAAGSSTILWESQAVTQAGKSGGFKFSTTNLPQDCVGELSDGVSTINVVISGCTTHVVSGSVLKTGQTTSYAAGDDGDLQKGISTAPNPRFTDNGNGTVTDNLTGLIWLTNANCIGTLNPSFDNDGTVGDGMVSWQHALDFVASINVGTNCGDTSNGGSHQPDWRLPNRNELASLFDIGQGNPALPPGHPFTNFQSFYYWSSSTYIDNTSRAWLMNFPFGDVNTDAKSAPRFVTAVRGGL